MITNTFVQNLKYEIENTKIYNPTGKYGKNVYDSYKTSRARFDVLLAAEPRTSEDLLAYTIYLDSIEALKNSQIRKKIKTLLEYTNATKEQAQKIKKHLKPYNKRIRIGKFLSWLISFIFWSSLIFWYLWDIMDCVIIVQILWFIAVPVIKLIVLDNIKDSIKSKFIIDDYNPF